METTNTSLLPYVLDILSRQNDYCTTIDAICEKMHNMIPENRLIPFGDLRGAVEFAVNLGVNLGLLTLSDKRLRVPFNFRGKHNKKQTQTAERKAKKVQKKGHHLAKSVRCLFLSKHKNVLSLFLPLQILRRLPVFKQMKKFPLKNRPAVRAKCAVQRPKTQVTRGNRRNSGKTRTYR
ncbi:GH17252 [Drosophila grimshawi]|uniref:GH17252 n=1 Tax=Drosophila grimshawi TaxID=7222 RepID=B4JBC8_DROGR|nr:GH17252 [Drosophila grimshawi]